MSVTGKYEYVDGDNFEGYLVASGVSPEFVEIGKAIRPKLEFVEVNPNEFKMNIQTELTNKDVHIKLGESVTEKTPDGRTLTATFSKNGNKLSQKQKFDNGFEATLDHEFKPDGLTLTYSWNGGKATRNYKRV